jgi:mannose-P-dolichol utilization defect protein 1
MQAGVIPIFLASKVPQILTNYTNSSTGQLSAFTVFNYFFGSLARVFTTIQEVNDSIILLGFVLTTVLNAVLALQMVYYWNNTDTKQVVVDAAAPETPETPRRSMRRRKTAK